MLKNLIGGAGIINYGPTLPDAATAYDGQLFYKTGANSGLYLFGFNQDSSSATGDQVSQGWSQATSGELYVAKSGDTMSGDLVIQSGGTYRGLRVLNQAGASGGSIGAASGTGQGILISGEAGPISFTAGNTPRMQLTTAGVLNLTTSAGTSAVWTGLNDGAGSGLDADLLDGQDSTYYQNASNINAGTLNIARFPFTPVQQGGGGVQGPNKVYIGWATGGSNLRVQVDTTDFGSTWPISITGASATASSANTANTATNATNAVSAQYVRAGGNAGGTNYTFTWYDDGGQPSYLWGGTNGVNMQVYPPGRLNVNYAGSSGYAGSAGYANNAGTVNDIGGHLPGIRSYVMPYAANSDLGTLIAAVFNNVSCGVLQAALTRCGYSQGGGPGQGPVMGF